MGTFFGTSIFGLKTGVKNRKNLEKCARFEEKCALFLEKLGTFRCFFALFFREKYKESL